MDAGNLLDKVSDHLSVRRAFGAAYEKDGAWCGCSPVPGPVGRSRHHRP